MIYYPLLDNGIDDLEDIIKYFKDDKIYVSPFLKVLPYSKNIWYESPLNSEHYSKLIQRLTPISYLLEYYKKTDEDWCLEKALSLFYLWYEENEKINNNNTSFDMGVLSYRLIVVCNLLSISEELELCILEEVFEIVIKGHIKKIKQFYLSNNMDGIMQDISLYIATLTMNNYFQSNISDDLDLSLSRLYQQLDYFILDDSSFIGQKLEDSYLLYHRLCKLYDFVNDDEYKLLLTAKINLLLAFLYAFLEPNGYLPPIGESTYYKIPFKSFSYFPSTLSEYIKELYLDRLDNIIYTNVFLKKGNYFVTINYEKDIDYIKLIFCSAFHQTIKKQNDDLSFILYINNLLVFIDGGVFNYQKAHPLKQAIDSIYSHNTICIDSFPYPIKENKINHCGIMNAVIKREVSYCSGVSLLYDDVLLKRSMLLIHHKSLLIIDEIIGMDSHLFEIIFNINPIIKLKKKNKAYVGFLNNDPLFTLQPIFSTTALDHKYYYGNKKTKKGFFCHDGANPKKNHCITYVGNGSKVLVVTQINFEQYKEPCEVTASCNTIQLSIDNLHFTLNQNPYYNQLYLGNVHLEDIKNDNLTLKKALDSFYKKANINLKQS